MELIITLIKGKWFMFPLVLCSITMVAVILERRRSLAEATIDINAFVGRIRDLFKSGGLDEALGTCSETPGPVARILHAGLHRYKLLKEAGRSTAEIEEGTVSAMEDMAPHVIAGLEKYLVVLATIGNVAPLLGFAGTVTGMIASFNTIVEKQGMKPADVAGGISEALITTATGLLIAIPAYIAYNYFTQRVQQFVLDIEESSTHLIEAMTMEGADS